MMNTRFVAEIGMATATVGILLLFAAPTADAQTGTLGAPFAPPSPNAALHYQRALLLMSALDEADHNLLHKNVWEVLPGNRPEKGTVGRIKRMLYRARNATDAAGKGSRLETCNFGIDFSDSGAATVLPHVAPMVELGRLLTLRGAYAQSQGKWDEAAVIYFDGLRMGRHLTHLPTLLESVAGMQILENNYYALAHWASECPNANSVARVFGLFEVMSDDLIRPSGTLASETSILAMDFDFLLRNYPGGPWGTAILQDLGKDPQQDENKNRELAVAACVDAGVPQGVFENTQSFRKYLAALKELDLRFAEAAANAMRLPVQARIERGEKLYRRYQQAVGELGKDSLLNPAEIGAMFAQHEAEITLLRVALAVASGRNDKGFPKSLETIASGFGGVIPASPYDDSPLNYEVLDEAKSFQISINETRVGDYVLPRVEFTNAAPTKAN